VNLLVMWLFYTFFGVGFFSLVFIWAVRTRQFSDPRRTARLVVEDLPAAEDLPPATGRAWGVLLAPVIMLAAAALVLGGTAVYIFTR
jgi:cbb3-type cytochrome oxidase maturation protein